MSPNFTLTPRFRALAEAFLVTFLWSTSWVLIKVGLKDIPPLVFAGLRYSLAFLFLAAYALPMLQHRSAIRALSRPQWLLLIGLGVLFVAVTQGAQFLSLSYLPATMISLLLNFTSIVVLLFGIIFLAERPTSRQLIGLGIFLLGVMLYFQPANSAPPSAAGLLAVTVGVLANAGSAVLGRYVNRQAQVDPLIVTLVSIGAGSLLLLVIGVLVQGLPVLTWQHWAIIAWLAGVNTAFAFTLWNRALRQLSAVESSVINNSMTIQIALLAWLFLGEDLSTRTVATLLLAAVGVFLVQWRNGSSVKSVEARAGSDDLSAAE
ncbi:MAG: DMT family transporter [Anaerolineae bacterium]|nr:DMT family transporter [Anaerolineae bacterium]